MLKKWLKRKQRARTEGKMLQKQERIERFKGQMITNKKHYPEKPSEQ